MPDRKFLSVFTPSRTRPEDLEAIFVQRNEMLNDALERVRESASTDNKHHLLFVGPRGTGKTNLVTLLAHRLSKDEELNKYLRTAWLNEDETSTTLLEFLHRIYIALSKRHPEEFTQEALAPMFDFEQEEAERWLAQRLLTNLQNHTLLVIVENLDALFQGLGKSGQHKLRAFIQENPVVSIVATAQRLVDDLSKRNSAFFGFFQTEQLKTLSVEEASELLSKITDLNGQTEATKFLRSATGRARIRALHHLSGGNHRIYIVLSQFITRESIDELVGPFSKMIDEMTPYYQERIRWLPAQQRKIVEYLCSCERPTSVKEMARQLFASPQTISSQLKDLREKGYVQAAQRGRESLYEITEPLMRICVEIKENQSQQPLRVLVDFLRVWYNGQELSSQLDQCNTESSAHRYLKSALEKNTAQGNLRAKLLVEGFRSELLGQGNEPWTSRIEFYAQESEELALACGEWASGNDDQALSTLKEIIDEASNHPTLIRSKACLLAGEICFKNEHFEEAATYYSIVINSTENPVYLLASALFNRALAHKNCGDLDKELADYNTLIELTDAPIKLLASAFLNRGVLHSTRSDLNKGIADYNTLIELIDAPVELLAKALLYRGITHGQRGDVEKELTDYNTLIELTDAPVELLAKALLNRGILHTTRIDLNKGIADYNTLIELTEAPADQIAKAHLCRGILLQHQGNAKKAEKDFEAASQSKDLPTLMYVDVHFIVAEANIKEGHWDSAITTIARGLKKGTKDNNPYLGNSIEIVDSFFESSTTPKIQRKRAHELAQLYQANNAIQQLGEAITRHLGLLYADKENLPASDSLELWASSWEAAGKEIDAFRLPLRIFRTGIDFLKSGGKDRGILLDLNQEERKILEQTLDLPAIQ